MDRQRRIALLTSVSTTSLLLLFTAQTCFAGWTQESLTSNRVKVLLTAPFGMYAGIWDDSPVYPLPYNGVYASFDLGQTWTKSGLDSKGITGLTYLEDTLFAGTYYTDAKPSGVYKSTDRGKTWSHSGLTYPGISLASTATSLLYGTDARGLFRSIDKGATWQQVIGSGFSSGIRALAGYKAKALAASKDNKVYISYDNGASWIEVSALKDKIAANLYINEQIMLAGTANSEGLFRSTDSGISWHKVLDWGAKPAGPFSELKGVIYAGGLSSKTGALGVFASTDSGLTWTDISQGLPGNIQNITSMSSVYSKPDQLLFSTHSGGIYSYSIPSPVSSDLPIFDLPWEYTDFNLAAQNISSFFDHKYPLLGYSYYKEPADTAKTTINFKGVEAAIPTMYYSSHNGVDFPLKYGTPVLAVAEGLASYSYSSGTGNMIRINHQNGYQTWYMHLQNTGLVVSKPLDPVFVKAHQKIGLVGMTGNTNGPHIHFTVLEDINKNGVFDDFPDGVVDPYGWQNEFTQDPWAKFSWLDTLGTHHGSASKYLWSNYLNSFHALASISLARVISGIKVFDIPSELTNKILNLDISEFPTALSQGESLAIGGAGFEISSYDISGNPINNYLKDINVSIDYSGINTEKIIENTLKIFKWDQNNRSWIPVPSAVDTNNKKITGLVSSSGQYAVMGAASDTTPPVTEAQISGDCNEGVCTTAVSVNLVAQDQNGSGLDSIFFSLDNEENWEKYEAPITLQDNGTYKLFYKSIDLNGNIETAKSVEFTINRTGFSKVLKVVQASFSTTSW